MTDKLVGVGGGRLAFAVLWGYVTAAYRSHPRYGAAWLVDGRVQGGGPFAKARVIGERRPLVHTKATPSWGVIMYLGANTSDPVFLPCPWAGASPEEIERADQLAVGEHFQVEITSDEAPGGTDPDAAGAYVIRRPGAAYSGAADHEYLRITSGSRDGEARGQVEVLGGVTRMARGPRIEEGDGGDYVAINAGSSPEFVAWMQAMQATLTGLVAWAVAPPPGPDGRLSFVPPVPPLVPVLPTDNVPAQDGEAAIPAAGTQAVGQIVTGSTHLTGR